MIVAIDDQPEILFVVKRYLQDLFEVETYNDEVEAVEYVLDNSIKVDLIIVDYNMPNLTGPEFIKKIFDGGYKNKVLVYSGEPKDTLNYLTEAYPNVFFLSKPVLKSNLIAKVKELLGGKYNF